MAPSITTPPSAQSVTVGDPVTFKVVATGTAPLSYQWYLNNVAIAGATADAYSIASVQSANAGNYTVTVSNGTLPSATSTAVALTVNPVVVAPTITTYPASQSVVTGNSASFTVVATGSAPLSYQWHLDNVNVGTNSSSYQSATSTALGNHTVTVTVSNAAGSVVSNPAALTVTAALVAPSITTGPSVQSVTVGDPVTFTVVATGTAPLSYQWYQGTTAVGGNSPSYTIAAAQSANAGSYTVTVSNGIAPAVTSTPVTLTVSAAPGAPTIQSLTPSSQSVLVGSGATFTASASGTAPLFYQWQLNGSNVGSNSASYTSDPTLAEATYDVTVTVTNAVSSATSATATLTVAPLTVTLPGSLALSMTPIPAGTFMMGGAPGDSYDQINESSDPYSPVQLQVTISQNYYMGTYLVTQAQWTQLMGSNPSYFQTTGGGSPTNDLQRPVEQVSYTDITGFLAFLNANMTTICPLCPTSYVFRLPTEAEWEYACRAGTTTSWYWGDNTGGTCLNGGPLMNANAWYSGDDGSTTKPVGMLLPNAWGLYDMAGNVWEWCQDWYEGQYDCGPDTDPVGPPTGSGSTTRVCRGGSWLYDGLGAIDCRSARRDCAVPDNRYYAIGFRVVLAPWPLRTISQ